MCMYCDILIPSYLFKKKDMALIEYFGAPKLPHPEIDIPVAIESGRVGTVFISPLSDFPLNQPYPNMSKNVRARDSGIYTLTDILRSFDIGLAHADSLYLDWDDVLEFHPELGRHIREDGAQYPKAETFFQALTTGEWTRLAFSAEETNGIPLQETLHRIRGGYNYYSATEPCIPLKMGVKIRPLRSIFGDCNVAQNSAAIWPIPVGYNFMHVPDDVRDSVSTNLVWENIRTRKLCLQ